MSLITTTADLAALCAELRSAPFVAVDTEFMRERTYWPKLCLVQLGVPGTAAAIDPMADGIDLEPLYELLRDPKVLKVFHAARQDLEIFAHAMGEVPAPIADTQVMAMVAGFGESVSYETLAARLANARIDKSSRFTDWGQRPLSERQITYALADVIHLCTAYPKLETMLAKKGRISWIESEMAILENIRTYKLEAEAMWQRMKFRPDSPKVNTYVKALAAWRERAAQRINIPRQRVLKDEALLDIAFHPPSDVAALKAVRGLPQGFTEGPLGTELMTVLGEVKSMPESDWLHIPRDRNGNNPPVGAVVDLLRVLLKHVAEQEGIAASLIAKADDLESIALDRTEDVPAMSGWRYEVFGRQADALRSGRLALGLKGNKVQLIERSTDN